MDDERIRQMAQEADPDFGNLDGDMPDALCGIEAITRFAQLVAEDCADIVDNADTPDCGGWSACEIANDIRARYNR